MSIQRNTIGLAFLALAVSGIVKSGLVIAQDAPPAPSSPASPDAPAVTADTSGAGRTRLPADYAALSDLTADEKTKLLAIREKTDQEIRDLRAKEVADMEATLTDAQRAELKEIDAKQQAAAKAARAQERLQQRIETNQDKLNSLKEKADDPGATP